MSGLARCRTRSTEDTEALGADLAPLVAPGDVLLVGGPLGAGKTRLVAGLARGLGVRSRVRSPTFTLIGEYHGRLLLVHVDLYRLQEPVDPLPLGLDEYREQGVLAVEWGERLPDAWRADALNVRLEFAGADERTVTARGRGPRGEELAAAWTTGWEPR
jgi:tRNA threonylcarbamoyladenosine biosynthesis protein TsaE